MWRQIDELGKGTAANDGIALLAASLKELLKLGARTVVRTTFPCRSKSALP